ncbi:MAG: C25 family peptidase propeptide domain-containing protein, partial [bacterium]
MRTESRTHRSPLGLFAFWIGMCAVTVACYALPAAAAEREGRPILLAASDSRITFEVDVSGFSLDRSTGVEGAEVLNTPGMGSFSEPGQPKIPGRIYLAAIPPGAAYSVGFAVVSSVPLGRHLLEPVPFPLVLEDDNGETYVTEEYRLDAPLYNTGGSEIGATADPEARIRHQRVLPVRVKPLSYDPVTGETSLATRIRIDITLRSGRAGRLFGDETAVPVGEAPVWERIYSQVLVNPGQAPGWRIQPRRPRTAGTSGRTREALFGPLVKIGVRATGLHRARAAALIDKGLPVGTAVSDLHLFKRVYDGDALSETIVDIPYRVIEDPAGTAGTFDGADEIVFYGQRL